MDDVAGVNDHVRRRVERVDVGDGEREVAHSPLGVACVEREMRVGDLRDDHEIAPGYLVIARSVSDEAIQLSFRNLDCFASLAMTTK